MSSKPGKTVLSRRSRNISIGPTSLKSAKFVNIPSNFGVSDKPKDGVEAPLDRARDGVGVGGVCAVVGGRPVPEREDGAAAGPAATVHGREARFVDRDSKIPY